MFYSTGSLGSRTAPFGSRRAAVLGQHPLTSANWITFGRAGASPTYGHNLPVRIGILPSETLGEMALASANFRQAAGLGPRSCRPVGGPSPAVTGMPSPPHSPGKRHLDASADAVSRSAADQATAQSRVSKHHGAAFWALIDSWKVSGEAALRRRVELPLKGRDVFVDRKPFPDREAR